MKIPKDPAERMAFFRDLLTKVNYTRGERRSRYNILRSFYLYGYGPDTSGAIGYNKIYPHIDQLASFMFAGETTRFNIELGESVNIDPKIGEGRKVPAMNRALQKEWQHSGSDTLFGQAVRWASCYGSMFWKARWKGDGPNADTDGGIDPCLVEPHNFSVLREDEQGLENQEAFSHSYLMTKSQIANKLKAAEHKRINEIMSRVVGSPRSATQTANVSDRIIVSAIQPNIVGSLEGGVWFGLQDNYRPKTMEELVELNELYVWDDEFGDYTVVTIADPDEILWDRPLANMFLKNESPFTQVCPNPASDYFWGYSEVERLIPLQTLRNERMTQIRHMLELQAKPPKSASGFESPIDEMALALDSPNGLAVSSMPGGKIDSHQPTIPDDLYKEIREIDIMFDEMSGLTNVNQGRGEAGVRSAGHAAQLSKLGSSRAKNRALVIEDALEKIATKYVHIMKRYSRRKLRADGQDGEQFIANQFTGDFMAKVDAHSNSPIFMEDQTALAFKLLEVGAIDKEELLQLVEVPMRDLLLDKLRTKIEPAAAAAQAKKEQLEEAKVRQIGRGKA